MDMKSFNILIIVFLLFASCKQEEKKANLESKQEITAQFDSFGAEITSDSSNTPELMLLAYAQLNAADTLTTKFTAKVNEVCQAKGCWMKVALADSTEVMVKFKDYAFFMPKDISGKEVIMNGKAFVSEMSVEDQRHFAMDGGADEEEIALITEPKKTLSFEADGVLIKQ